MRFNPCTAPAPRRAALPVAAALLAVSCGGGGGGSGEAAFGLEGTYEVTGLGFDFGITQPGDIGRTTPYPGLSLSPLELLPLPGEDRIVTIDKSGFAAIFDDDPAVTTSELYFDLNSQVADGGEGGLLSAAFAPNFPTDPWIYVFYAAGAPLRSVVSRIEVVSGIPEPSTEEILLEVPKTNEFHFGGKLAFGPDDLLYVSIGDDGVSDHAQDLGRLEGKLLRLTATGAPAPGNPFGAVSGARPEVFAYGLRNLWRFSFDSMTGELWGADVGENEREEIDIIQAGGNYGWPLFEGSLEYDNPSGVDYATTEPPLFEYDHGVGSSIIGGFVYRGTELPSLDGAYLYTDSVAGTVWALRKSGTTVLSNEVIATGLAMPVAFGTDNAGSPLVGTLASSQIVGFEETGSGPTGEVPMTLSETLVFDNLATLTPRAGFVPYGVNSPLWSDGAKKLRWLGLPPGGRMTFDRSGNWIFPVGAIFVKQFDLDLLDGSTTRLETRIMYRTISQWEAYTYRWNEAQTDAVRVDSPETAVYSIPAPELPGGTMDLTWNFPSPAQCFACHTPAAGYGLGVRTEQLNGDYGYPLATDNQLRAMEHVNFFTSGIGDTESLPRLVDPADTTQLLPDRARSYLSINCAVCHLPNSPTGIEMDLRALTPTELMNTHDVAPLVSDLGLPNAARIRPFATESSVLHARMSSLELGVRMPPLASGRVDPVGVEVIDDWIAGGALDPNGSLGTE